MGLSVLPSRLKQELEILADYLAQKKDIRSNEKIAKHADWADTFCKKLDGITEENVMDILKKEVGEVFVHVLEDAGVYKCTEKGREAFLRFVKTLLDVRKTSKIRRDEKPGRFLAFCHV